MNLEGNKVHSIDLGASFKVNSQPVERRSERGDGLRNAFRVREPPASSIIRELPGPQAQAPTVLTQHLIKVFEPYCL